PAQPPLGRCAAGSWVVPDPLDRGGKVAIQQGGPPRISVWHRYHTEGTLLSGTGSGQAVDATRRGPPAARVRLIRRVNRPLRSDVGRMPVIEDPTHRAPARRAPLKDVALAAGVSESTTSRAISGEGYVAADVRARVLAAAEELGYV